MELSPIEGYLCEAFKAPSLTYLQASLRKLHCSIVTFRSDAGWMYPVILFLQDLINSAVLSECVYKCVSTGSDRALHALNQFQHQFPAGLVSLLRIQPSRPHVLHRQELALG